MRGLKLLVIGLGLAVVVGTGVLIWGVIAKRDARLEAALPVASVGEQSGKATAPFFDAPFGDVTVALPPGARVHDVEVRDGLALVTFTVDGKDGAVGVAAFDLRRGRSLGTVQFARPPEAPESSPQSIPAPSP